MSAVFDDVRLPEEIEQGSTGGPSFSTSIVRLGSGAEARNQNWQQQRMVYDVGYGISSSAVDSDDPSNFYVVQTFFYARRGRFRGFRFKDWTDYQAFNEPAAKIGTDGLTWQLQKTYAGPVPYSRKITRPVSGTLSLVNGSGVINPTFYSVANGLITFTAGHAQTVVTASFEFDVPVRFDTDVFTLTIQLYNAAMIQSLTITEVLE